MNKAALIKALSERLNIPKRQAEQCIETLVELVMESLSRQEDVTIAGFGTFMAKVRSSRMGVNPQNPSQPMRIPAVMIPKFRAGKNLKEALKKVTPSQNAAS